MADEAVWVIGETGVVEGPFANATRSATERRPDIGKIFGNLVIRWITEILFQQPNRVQCFEKREVVSIARYKKSYSTAHRGNYDTMTKEN